MNKDILGKRKLNDLYECNLEQRGISKKLSICKVSEKNSVNSETFFFRKYQLDSDFKLNHNEILDTGALSSMEELESCINCFYDFQIFMQKQNDDFLSNFFII